MEIRFVPSMYCAMHSFSTNRYCSGVILIGFLGSPAAHALCYDKNADTPSVLKRSWSLGEAAAQTVLQRKKAGECLPAVDNTPLALKLSESLGGVALAGGLVPTVPLPTALLPTAPLPLVPPASEPLKVDLEKGVTKKGVTKKGVTKKGVTKKGVTKKGAVDKLAAKLAAKITALMNSASYFAQNLLYRYGVKRPPPEEGAEDRPKFGIAPIRWGGDVSETLRWRRYASADSSTTTLENMQTLNLRASSYIWQPWITRVDWGIGMSHISTSTDGSSGDSSYALSGNGALSVFPTSRFPFSASYTVTDTRTNSSWTSTDYIDKHLILRQTYQPISGAYFLSGNFEHSVLSGSSFGDDIVSAFQGSYTTRLAGSKEKGSSNQRLVVSVSHTESSQQGGNSGLTFNSLAGSHSYQSGSSQLVIASGASLAQSDWRGATGAAANSNTSRYLQADTSATWRPDTEKPLSVGGNIYYYNAATTNENSTTRSQSLSSNIQASYSPIERVSLGVSGGATYIDSNNYTSVITMQGANASYSADPTTFGKGIIYSWNVNGNVNNQTNSSTNIAGNVGNQTNVSPKKNNLSASVSGSQSLTFPCSFKTGLNLDCSVSQSLASSHSGLSGISHTLAHGGSMSWRSIADEKQSSTATVSGGDSRSFGATEGNYQYATFNLNGQRNISIYSSMSANAAVNWNRQSTTGSASASGSAGVSYLHARAFNVRGLRYSLIGSMQTAMQDQRILGSVNAQRKTESTVSLEQNLNYRIGLINTSASALLSKTGDQDNVGIFVRISRIFGRM